MELRDLIGVQYKEKGRTKDEGFDCYGLAIEVYRRLGITLKDVWKDKKECDVIKGLQLEKIDTPVLWCLVAFRVFNQNHIGVYIGSGQVLHCGFFGVCVQDISEILGNVTGYYVV